MSAITGIFILNGKTIDPNDIIKMNKQLDHRGPNGSATWNNKKIALGHQMLHTTQESLYEKLPFEDKDSNLIITADARIDNRKELSEKLNIPNEKNVPDSYFILKSYKKWGDKCSEELLGDFAFVIWDKNNEKLFCARDHMGIKPFYYYLSKEAFYFASEIKALTILPEIPKKVNEKKLAQFLTNNISDKLNTFYQDIIKLMPAHTLTIDRNGIKINKYWELDPDFHLELDSDEKYFETFREIFTEAIKCRLRSPFPLGFELSGGLDSSSIVCITRKLITENKVGFTDINTYSYVFDDFPEVDERFYINKVIDGGRINYNFVFGDEITPLDEIDEILWYQEQPFFTPNMSIIWKERQKMKENNIRVLLTGDGGDEVISSGYLFLKELALDFKWRKLFEEIQAISENRGIKLYKLIFTYFFLPFVPKTMIKIVSLWKKKDMFHKDGTFILNHEFADRAGGEEYLKKIKWEPLEKINTAKKFHYFTLNMDPYVLEMHDKIVAAFEIEQRYPYFDKRLIEFCYSIPSEMKFKKGWNRFIQRFALSDILPPEIQSRTVKTNFNPVYEKYLLKNGKIVGKIVYENKIGKYLDLKKIREIYQNYKSGIDEKNNIFAVWLSLLLFKWLKKEKL